VTVNAIDELRYDGGYARRRAIDVTRVRALFADFDDATKPPPTFALPPSMVVESSPGKHHVYWLADGVPLGEFSARQRGIVEAYGSDPSCVDLSRAMRLPGFAHVKDPERPWPTRLLDASGRRYRARELAEAFPFAVPRVTGEYVWDGVIDPLSLMVWKIVEESWPEMREPGKHFVPCPWGHLHSSQGTPSATAYFAPSAENRGRGAFKCLHAHCANRGIEDYARWLLELLDSRSAV
jgi:hypothetical protein